jgi:geranylgeranyl diphosphate synthase type II
MTTDAAEVGDLLRRHGEATEAFLRDELPRRTSLGQAPTRLREAIDYSLLAGGKRLRPTLVIECCVACGGDIETALPAAAAVELIHCFSLVHDDLPAMDDDDLRRGRPTNHKVFGEAAAVLAGDAMTTLAFELLAASYAPAVAGKLVQELAVATGPAGMIGGQMLDIAAEGKQINLAALRDLHGKKTAALLAGSCVLGGLVAGGSQESLTALRTFGHHLGLAFQIRDDVLDVTATPEAMGKATAKDAAAGKNTYPSLLGLDEAAELAEREAANASDVAAKLSSDTRRLAVLARFAAARAR